MIRPLPLPGNSFPLTFPLAHLSLAMLELLLLPQQGKLVAVSPLLPLIFPSLSTPSLRSSHDSLSFYSDLCSNDSSSERLYLSTLKEPFPYPYSPPLISVLVLYFALLFFFGNTYQNLKLCCLSICYFYSLSSLLEC